MLRFVAFLVGFAALSLACGGDSADLAPTRTPAVAGVTPAPVAEPTWSQRAPLPSPRSEVSSAVLDGKIYVIGGFTATAQRSNVLEAYDVATDRWQRLASMPVGRDHTMATAFGGKVYVFGGGLGQPSNEAYVYDPATDSWSRLADMPFRRTSGGAAVIEDRIIVVGGVGDSPTVTMVYNPANDSWAMGPSLNGPREHLGVTALDGKVYALAGRWNMVLSDRTEVLESLGGEWRLLAPLPTARGGTSAGVVDGRIYVAGGEDFNPNRTFREVEAYDPARDAWIQMPHLPTPRHGLAVEGVGDTLFVIGGGPTAGLSVSPANEALTVPSRP